MMIEEEREQTKQEIQNDALMIGLLIGFVLATIVWLFLYDPVPY